MDFEHFPPQEYLFSFWVTDDQWDNACHNMQMSWFTNRTHELIDMHSHILSMGLPVVSTIYKTALLPIPTNALMHHYQTALARLLSCGRMSGWANFWYQLTHQLCWRGWGNQQNCPLNAYWTDIWPHSTYWADICPLTTYCADTCLCSNHDLDLDLNLFNCYTVLIPWGCTYQEICYY